MNLKQISKNMLTNIDAFCVDHFSDEPRTHLGASLIGHECSRYLWYVFRWCVNEEFSGRMYRLFERGHLEEMRFVKWLEGIGCRVETDYFSENRLCLDSTTGEYFILPKNEIHLAYDDVSDNPAHVHYAKFLGIKIPQFTVSGVNGHFGGSMDGLVLLPPEYGIDGPVILEGKTMLTGSPFNNLRKNGVLLEKPQHFDQQSVYGYKTGIKHAVYICTNKNNDDLHLEVIELDHERGKQCELKAERIINSQEPPFKLSPNKTFFKCTYCAARSICHEGAIPLKNCRSCIHSHAVENKEWFCDKWGMNIPKEHIKDGCGEHYPITAQ